ncbi:MAG: hypothetical protein ABSA46_06895 [Thermodesulfovibrionales bacterium]
MTMLRGSLTPPYHEYNATNVDVSYDFTAKDAVSYGPRDVRFPLNNVDAERAFNLYEKLIRSEGSQFTETWREMESMPHGIAKFSIIDSKIGRSGAENQERGRIEWLKFEIIVTLPCAVVEQKD